MVDIQITDISNGSITTNPEGQYVWTGTGIFDRLMTAINGNVKVEYDNGRITSTEYATVYLGALQSAIAASMDYLLREKLIEEQIAETSAKVDLLEEQAISEQKNQLVKDAQKLLIDRQKAAYDDNLRVEAAKMSKDRIFGFSLGGITEWINQDTLNELEARINSVYDIP